MTTSHRSWSNCFSRLFVGESSLNCYYWRGNVSMTKHIIFARIHCSLLSCSSSRSSNKFLLTVLRTISSYRNHSFSECAPKLWNSLPMNICETASLEQFKKLLKVICLTVLITHYDIWLCNDYICFLIVILCSTCFYDDCVMYFYVPSVLQRLGICFHTWTALYKCFIIIIIILEGTCRHKIWK